MGADYVQPGTAIGPDMLDAVTSWAGVPPRPGDVIMVQTGILPAMRRRGQPPPAELPGLTWECARWMHDHDIAAVCADNLAVEIVGGAATHLRCRFT